LRTTTMSVPISRVEELDMEGKGEGDREGEGVDREGDDVDLERSFRRRLCTLGRAMTRHTMVGFGEFKKRSTLNKVFIQQQTLPLFYYFIAAATSPRRPVAACGFIVTNAIVLRWVISMNVLHTAATQNLKA
jgi:hypothetical protein